MKKLHLLFSAIIALFLCTVSCEKDEVVKVEKSITGTLSFNSLTNPLSDAVSRSFLDSNIPECKNVTPKFVRISLKYLNPDTQNWEWYKNSNNSKIEIQVNPNGTDTDGDNVPDSWFTMESLDLELRAGKYSLEYFAITEGSGNSAEILFLAPRIPGNYPSQEISPILFHNFVDKPLPIEIEIRSGVKYYQPVEVLCYEDDYFFNFGYLFFDFTTDDLPSICVYGNYCYKNGKHSPAQFKIKVWKDEINTSNLLLSAENKVKSFITEDGSTQYYAEAICFPLPDYPTYYAKIWLVKSGEDDILIRQGSFTKEDLKNLYDEQNEISLYHFREGCCETQDNVTLLEDTTNADEDCAEPEDPPVIDCSVCDSYSGKVHEISFKYTGSEDIVLSVNYQGSGNEYEPLSNITVAPGDIINITGAFDHASHGLIIGNNLVFEIKDKSDEYLHTSCSQILYLGLNTKLDNNSDNSSGNDGSFQITRIKMSGGAECPNPD
ncbi:hypothetical protein [Christiangramia sp. OXR-203]|jgi:hypothetical protein|uniref:hypothetical protein n=1 Tax=Christiangramia sp. OXR-203 TaxID=3100176 RepID=UPI002AC8EEA3|nr:hypothetical protein [Christiangramia sp. OXR-203]WPY99682.1 hypothetical protein T8I65_05595 [Christiangramia sp. OXR-203]